MSCPVVPCARRAAVLPPRLPPVIRLLAALAPAGLPWAAAAPVQLVEQPPVAITSPARGVVLLDFGKVAFGNLRLSPPAGADGTVRVHFGEASRDGRVDRKPPGTVRYAVAEARLDGAGQLVVAPPPDGRNTQPPAAVLTPAEWGVVLPFRWVEVEGWPGRLEPANAARRAAFAAGWDDAAAAFDSSDDLLDRVWELCRYSVKATTFAGVYVDGDRERIPYEADAYLNQLSHQATDHDVQMARDTFDRLLEHPTWPSEWAPHMVFIAHADWMHTGDAAWLAPRYGPLKGKLLLERAGADGLVTSNQQQRERSDIVDWPAGERDGFVFREVNTVVNAFHLAALARIAELARALGRQAEADDYAARAQQTRAAFNQALFMADKGAYRDGLGTDHASSHASLFPLAFGLVPDAHVPAVCEFLAGRGMTCSVYAAQYLLEGLFRNGADAAALGLITAAGDRSWRHMLESGTTITWEAWDQRYKPNQDWNHAWGAAPANLLPRFVLGAEPLSPGWKTARIRPCPGSLTEARGRVPTPLGPLAIHWERQPAAFGLELALPDGIQATVELPAPPHARAFIDGQPAAATRRGRWLALDAPVSGSRRIIAR